MRWQKVLFTLFFLGFLILTGVSLYLWQKVKNFEPVIYYNVPRDKSFVYSPQEPIFGLESYIKDTIGEEMTKLRNEKRNFIYIDLKNMKLTLYKEGEEFNSFPIVAKGADWSWGKIPPGIYQIDVKSQLLFSSIAKVWMPYAMRFYGNYFIHGWPYTPSGCLIRGTTSGGCIRLNTKDAEVVFNFVELGTPVLIFDEEEERSPLPPLTLQDNSKTILSETQGENILVADLDSGEILVKKDAKSQISAGPATLMMLALAAMESVDLEKRIVAKKWMYDNVSEGIIVSEKSYQGNTLLEIMLSRFSAEAALVLSRFLTPDKMLSLMNYKEKSLGILDTNLVDVIGVSSDSVTSLYDMAKFTRYIKIYRKTIFEHIKKGAFDSSAGKNNVFTSLEFEQNYQDSTQNSASSTRTVFIAIAIAKMLKMI